MVKIVKQSEIDITELRSKGTVILLGLSKITGTDRYFLYAQKGLLYMVDDYTVYFNYSDVHKCNYTEIKNKIAEFFENFSELCKTYDYVYYPNAIIKFDDYCGQTQTYDLIKVLGVPVVNKKNIVLEHIIVKINELARKLENELKLS
jgi:hypothetical protein